MGKRSEGLGQSVKALELVLKTRAFPQLLTVLPIVSVLLAQQDDACLKQRAVELYVLACCYPFVANSPFFKDIAGNYIATVSTTLPPDVAEAAQTRGRALDWWGTAEELLDELRALGWTDSTRT